MFDVGFTEILLIGIVSLVVIGPEKLPIVARKAGLMIGKLQRFVSGVKTDLASELETGDLKKLIGDQREQIDELRQMVSSAQKDIQSTTQDVVKSTRSGLAALETTVNEAKSDVSESSDTSHSAHSATKADNATDKDNTSQELKPETPRDAAANSQPDDQSQTDEPSIDPRNDKTGTSGSA